MSPQIFLALAEDPTITMNTVFRYWLRATPNGFWQQGFLKSKWGSVKFMTKNDENIQVSFGQLTSQVHLHKFFDNQILPIHLWLKRVQVVCNWGFLEKEEVRILFDWRWSCLQNTSRQVWQRNPGFEDPVKKLSCFSSQMIKMHERLQEHGQILCTKVHDWLYEYFCIIVQSLLELM